MKSYNRLEFNEILKTFLIIDGADNRMTKVGLFIKSSQDSFSRNCQQLEDPQVCRLLD